jgi:hypothetical protein
LEPIEDNTLVYQMLTEKLGITRHALAEFRVQAVVGSDAAYLPVYGPFIPNDRGAMVRFYDGSQPKAMTYKCTVQPWLAWYSYPAADIVIVEDQISAMRLWQIGYCGVALLGTNLSRDKLAEIKRMAGEVRSIHLCLDADMWQKTAGLVRKYPFLKGHMLRADFKNDTDDNIRSVLCDD